MSKTIVAALTAMLVLGCGKKKEETPPGTPAAGGGTTAPPAGGGGGPSESAPPPGEDKSGGAANTAATVTDCPKVLEGSETVNRILPKGCQTVVNGDYHVNGGRLEIEAGVTLKFKDGASLHAGYSDAAKLIVKGTADAPVLFTAEGDKVPGVWVGVRLWQHADRSSIEHLIVEFAGKDSDEAVKVDAEDVTITGSTIRGAKGLGMGVGQHGTLAKFAGNTFDGIGRFPVSLSAAAAGGLGEGNKFPGGSAVQIYGSTITSQVKWGNLGVPYFVSEDVHVEGDRGQKGALELAPGVELRMATSARIIVGYSSPGALKVVGTADAPVKLTAFESDKKPGAWTSVRIYGNGEGTFENAVFEYGGASEEGALQADNGTVSIVSCTFQKNGVAVLLQDRAKLRAFDKNRFQENENAAVVLSPSQLGMLGKDNKYGDKERIQVRGGRVDETTTWHAQTAPLEVLDNIDIDGRIVLTVEAGATFLQKDSTKWNVGWSDNGSLRLAGTPDKPIKLLGIRDEPGSWHGIFLYPNSRDSVLENVVIRNAGMGDEAGVSVRGNANAKITKLTCDKCTVAAVARECPAKLTASEVQATGGTKIAELKPEGCPP